MDVAKPSRAVRLRFRPVQPSDRGTIFGLLSQLTQAPPLPQPEFEQRVLDINKNPDHTVLVGEEAGREGVVVATGSLLVERKLLRGGGLVGHIEDVVVDQRLRGRGLGEKLVELLVDIAKQKGCYKVILDCSEENAAFYEKCGFQRKEVHMANYF